jgi:hypothetical protein
LQSGLTRPDTGKDVDGGNKYIYTDYGYTKTHPVGHIVTLSQSGTIYIVFGDNVWHEDVSTGEYEIVNLPPNTISHWWLLSSDGNIVQGGTLLPTG